MPGADHATAVPDPGAAPPPAGRRAIVVVGALAAAAGLHAVLPFEPPVNKALALLCFIGALWLTEALHLAVTALLVPVAALALGFEGLTTTQAFAPFADPIIFLFFGGFALATALRVQQLDRKMAVTLLALARGHLGATVLLLFAATNLLSLGISNTATAAIMLPLALGLLGALGDAQGERRTRVFVMLGVAYTASLGGIGTLVGSPPNAIAARAAGIDFAGWLGIGIPLMLVLVPLMWALLWLLLRPTLHRRVRIEMQTVPWNRPRRLTLLVFALTALGWVFGGAPLRAIGIQSPDSVVAVLAAIAVVGLGLASWEQVRQHTDWGVLLLFGGGLALGDVLGRSGASLVLGQQLAQVLQGAPPWLVLAAIAAFMVVLSEFASNTAAAALLVPVFAAVAAQMGLPTETLVVLVALAASCGFALPVATPPNAMVYGTGRVPQRQMIRAGLALDALCVLVLMAWGLLTLRT